jgi:anti-sigma28 factor (negative regulator of flagellin synthesis)
MGQINTTNLPVNVPDTIAAGSASRVTASPAPTSNAAADQIQSQDQLHFTKLSSVLNNWKQGTTKTRAKVGQVMSAVRSGSYQIEPQQVSRSIVNDSLITPN